jgi:hypothetical protein
MGTLSERLEVQHAGVSKTVDPEQRTQKAPA